MTNPDYERGAVNEKLRKLELEVSELRDDVREIRDAVVGFKGGWKTLTLLAGLSAVVGGIIVKITAWLIYLPK